MAAFGNDGEPVVAQAAIARGIAHRALLFHVADRGVIVLKSNRNFGFFRSAYPYGGGRIDDAPALQVALEPGAGVRHDISWPERQKTLVINFVQGNVHGIDENAVFDAGLAPRHQPPVAIGQRQLTDLHHERIKLQTHIYATA